MKNKIILLLAINLCHLATMAQRTAHTTSYFVVDNKATIEVQGAVPFSTLDFYSDQGGGHLVCSQLVNEQGNLSLQLSHNAMPAFCSSVLHASTQGTGMVSHFGQYEFNFSAYNHASLATTRQLAWQGIVPQGKSVYFDIMKSNDGVHFVVINTIQANPTNEAIEYHYDEAATEVYTAYKINVYANMQLKYTTPLVEFNTNNPFTLYPTVASTIITIQNKENKTDKKFTISNSNGQAVYNGILQTNTESIPISALASGLYYVHIQNEKEVLRFVKE